MTDHYKDLPQENLFGSIQLTPITTAQRDALVASAGMIIYNSDTDVLEFYDGTVWAGV